MVVIKTRLRKLTPVLTAAIIIRNIVWSDHAAELSLIRLFFLYQNNKAYLYDVRSNNVFHNVTFFMFTRISNVDAKPDLSLLSVKNHRSRLEPIYLISLFTFAV